VSFEEFLGRPEGRPLPINGGPPRILLHGHCHQKSMGGLSAAKALMERIPGTQVTDLDAGCCGMAGSFGYAREHFDVSRRIGERRLLPAARALKPDEALVAAGTSCRQQVSDFTGVRALHPAELLAMLLTASPQRSQRG
jgi:Fe-S oxidoreductase